MTIDLEKYKSLPGRADQKIKSSHEADSFFNREGFVGGFRDFAMSILRWYTFKAVVFALVFVVASAGWLQFHKLSEVDRDLIATNIAMAADGNTTALWEAVKIYVRGAEAKSELANEHPFYYTEAARVIQESLGVGIQKVFAYVHFEGQDFFLMKRVAQKDGADLLLDYSEMFGEDASGYCSVYNAEVSDSRIVEYAGNKLNLIMLSKGERFSDSDNWELPSKFRCMIRYADFEPAN